MDKAKLNILLDRVYELEGLIHLALNRDDDTHRIAQLMALKGEAVSRALAVVEENAIPQDAELPEGPNPLQEAEELISYSLEEEADKVTTSPAHEKEELTELADSQLYEEHEDSGMESTERASAIDEVTEKIEESAEPKAAVEEEGKGHSTQGITPAESTFDNEDDNNEDDNEEDEVEDDEAEDESQDDRVARPLIRNLRTLFSINDRFRFSRELFGGSTRRFDDSLAFLDMALDYNEVEDFFVSDQGMDPEEPVVKDFLEILSRAFAD